MLSDYADARDPVRRIPSSYRPEAYPLQSVLHCRKGILLALGSNRAGRWGTPGASLVRCLEELTAIGISVEAASSLYETAGVGPGQPPSFVNAVVQVNTVLAPQALLMRLKRLERAAGSRSAMPWGPRALDIDILSYKGQTAGWQRRGGPKPIRKRRASLVLPHPALHLRPFVLIPLLEIAPDWRHPVLAMSVRELVRRLPGDARGGVIRRIETTS